MDTIGDLGGPLFFGEILYQARGPEEGLGDVVPPAPWLVTAGDQRRRIVPQRAGEDGSVGYDVILLLQSVDSRIFDTI